MADDSTLLRRLPTAPEHHPTTRWRTPPLRPLPPVPQPLSCRQCQACITSEQLLFPPPSIPSTERRNFKGYTGKASLFTVTYNVTMSPPSVQLMVTGAHTMQEISCSRCSSYLGWKIVHAHERSEKWKEGACLLELESLLSHRPPDLAMTDRSSRDS